MISSRFRCVLPGGPLRKSYACPSDFVGCSLGRHQGHLGGSLCFRWVLPRRISGEPNDFLECSLGDLLGTSGKCNGSLNLVAGAP